MSGGVGQGGSAMRPRVQLSLRLKGSCPCTRVVSAEQLARWVRAVREAEGHLARLEAIERTDGGAFYIEELLGAGRALVGELQEEETDG